jgi:hypothetical protein
MLAAGAPGGEGGSGGGDAGKVGTRVIAASWYWCYMLELEPAQATSTSTGMKQSGTSLTFGLLILAQAAHSIEEYRGRLWESLPPARLVSGLISQDLELGFLAANVAIVTFGVWCFLWPVSRCWRVSTAIAFGWAAIELINGLGHTFWSLRQGGYTPGVVTAPFLFVLAIVLLRQRHSWRIAGGRPAP